MLYVVYCVVYSVCGEPKLCAPCHSAEVRTEARMRTGECMAPLRSEHGAVVMHRRARALRPEDERRPCLHRIAPTSIPLTHSQSIGAPCGRSAYDGTQREPLLHSRHSRRRRGTVSRASACLMLLHRRKEAVVDVDVGLQPCKPCHCSQCNAVLATRQC